MEWIRGISCVAEDAMFSLRVEAHDFVVKNISSDGTDVVDGTGAGGAGRSTRSYSVMTTLPICSLDSRYW
jgi:hypothetical protein